MEITYGKVPQSEILDTVLHSDIEKIKTVSYTHLDVYKRQEEIRELVNNGKATFYIGFDLSLIHIWTHREDRFFWGLRKNF